MVISVAFAIVGLYQRVQLGLLPSQETNQQTVEDEQKEKRYYRVEEYVVSEHVGAKQRVCDTCDQVKFVVDQMRVDERRQQVGYVDDYDQYNQYAKQSGFCFMLKIIISNQQILGNLNFWDYKKMPLDKNFS